MIDNQWPSYASSLNVDALDFSINESLVNEIEQFFRNKYHFPVVLFPSARASISTILSAHGIHRGNMVYAPKFSSHCVWDLITRYSNPSISVLDSTVAVISHKWGSVTNLGMNGETMPQLIIEDSVDSFMLDNLSLFPNKGQYEILSLPKILGTLSGGIVICKDEYYYEKLKNERAVLLDLNFSKQQSTLKAQKNILWMDNEYKNRSLSNFELQIIKNKLDDWVKWQDILLERYSKVKYLAEYKLEAFRIPPVIFIQKNIEGLMRRNFDIHQNANHPNYIEGCLFPIHLGIEQDEFEFNLTKIQEN